MDRLQVTFELDGLVLLHIGEALATAYLIPTSNNDHKQLLVAEALSVAGGDGELKSNPEDADFVLPPWKDTGYRYFDISDRACRLSCSGSIHFDRASDRSKTAGWADLFWALDMRFLTGRATIEPQCAPRAKIEFPAGWIQGREPHLEAMRQAEWDIANGPGGSVERRWLTDRLTVAVALEAPAGIARLDFTDLKTGASSGSLRLKRPDHGGDVAVVVSNMCQTGDERGALEMPDVREYGYFLGHEVVVPRLVSGGKLKVFSPNATRCPPAHF